MFQFPGFAPLAGWHAFSMPGCPIRTPADHIVRADPRSFSQLITSFLASESLGIPHAPLFSLSRYLPSNELLSGTAPWAAPRFVSCIFSQYVNEPLRPPKL